MVGVVETAAVALSMSSSELWHPALIPVTLAYCLGLLLRGLRNSSPLRWLHPRVDWQRRALTCPARVVALAVLVSWKIHKHMTVGCVFLAMQGLIPHPWWPLAVEKLLE